MSAERKAHVGGLCKETPRMRAALIDPQELTPEQRLDELAALLAEGARRWAREATLGQDLGQVSEESAATGLELSKTTRPDGSVRGLRPLETESRS
jgi:hypothetical protein